MDAYRRDEMDLDSVFEAAATYGCVLLPGEDKPYAQAKGGAYETRDLLLPAVEMWKSPSNAHKAGFQIFPEWFTYDKNRDRFDFNQEIFCREFASTYKLTRHHGAFLMDGKPTADDDVKEAIRRSLAIIRTDPGSGIYGAFSALKTICKDDAPIEKRTRLTRAALADELHSRGYDVRFNVISGEYETVGRTESGRVMTQDDLITLMHDALSDEYKGTSFDTLTQYIAFQARENQYNPVLELLASTQWDGVDRLPQLYNLVGVTDDALSKTLIRKWLYQAVALLFNDPSDPFGADGCLVLNGEQGVGKTSLFRHLAMRDAWFGEGCSIDDHDKDTGRRVITKWISELGEVESTLKSDISKLKAFVSASMDRYRLPYGKSDVVAPRFTSLCATCNSDRYLIDPTGNRRWWSVPFKRVMQHSELLELDALQLWAQMYAVVSPLKYQDKASCFRLSEDERKQLAERNGEYEKPLKGQPEVSDILYQAERDHHFMRKMTVSEFKGIWDILRPYSSQQISAALKACGIEITRTKMGAVAELPTLATINPAGK